MPAERLQDAPITIRKFDVAGQDSKDVAAFVRHVGLAMRHQDGLTRESDVRLVHMGPPLTQDDEGGASPVHTVATAELTADELLQIQVFVDELISEYKAEEARPNRQYIICPHATEPDEEFPFRRFSCAGFAVEAYRDADIELLNLGETSLPLVSLEMLKQAYPDLAGALDKERLRTAYGLSGDGPWHVPLAGYVINAMARDPKTIREVPYTANAGDEYFPARPPEDVAAKDASPEDSGQ